MDPADSRFASEGENLVHLWDYCWRIIHAASPYKRQLEVVFFDNFLSSSASTVSFLNINGLKQIITALRARLSFELFGMGGPGKEDSAALLEALATWCSQRQQPFLPRFIAKSFDPPLKKRCNPRHHHPTTLPFPPVVRTGAVVIFTPQQEQPQQSFSTSPFACPEPISTGKRRMRRQHSQSQQESGIMFEQPPSVQLAAQQPPSVQLAAQQPPVAQCPVSPAQQPLVAQFPVFPAQPPGL
ncbi:unnamed protein product [Oreochromis niloticus]|nr:unnamed protein product [Mustela putorius furo]